MTDPELTGVPETALMTLYNRASESLRSDAVVRDPMAESLFRALQYPFAQRFGRPDLSHVIRAMQFDAAVRDFLSRHPAGTVVALGEGLETQFWRVDNGTTRWVSVDLPEIVETRRRLLPESERCRLVACSALDPAWTRTVLPGQPTLILAQGLLMYFEPSEVEAFLGMLADRCAGAEVVFDTIPEWAATSVGHRQSSTYTMPPEPWGTGKRRLRRMLKLPGIVEVRFLPVPRGRGIAWGALYPALTRMVPALLPMTVAFRIERSEGTARS